MRSVADSWYFEDFIVSQGNKLAYEIAFAVSEASVLYNPVLYNPIVILGGHGVGKTHLLEAIQHKAIRSKCKRGVVLLDNERIISETGGLKPQEAALFFIDRYRDVGWLLTDDIQHILTTSEGQDMFYYMLDAFIKQGTQIILTCDKAPKDLTGIQHRLLVRLQSGVPVEIKPQDSVFVRDALSFWMGLYPEPPLTSEQLDMIAGRCSNYKQAERMFFAAVFAKTHGKSVEQAIIAHVPGDFSGFYGARKYWGR